MQSHRKMVTGPAGQLEVDAILPEQAQWRALVCHPHPQFGGTMDNKVVHTLFRLCRDEGAAVCRFNFRGVGKSEGEFDFTRGEMDDAVSVEQWLSEQVDAEPLWLAGFSFGSYIAFRLAERLALAGKPVAHLLLVAPPVHHNDFVQVGDLQCPVTVIQGSEDDVVEPEQVYQWAQSSKVHPEVHVVEGAGHFFHGQLNELKAIASDTLVHFTGQK